MCVLHFKCEQKIAFNMVIFVDFVHLYPLENGVEKKAHIYVCHLALILVLAHVTHCNRYGWRYKNLAHAWNTYACMASTSTSTSTSIERKRDIRACCYFDADKLVMNGFF